MTKWAEMFAMPSNWDARCDRYISSSDPGNFLMITSYSLRQRIIGAYNAGKRYGNIRPIIDGESFRAPGPWGNTQQSLYLS
ncbi:MAG: hypothetical protein H6Q18_254, partial [Bacteroidetes bacterium]|nr:hypothetical protein [Bacteroidota bacterium]